jgi:hypothetical protein
MENYERNMECIKQIRASLYQQIEGYKGEIDNHENLIAISQSSRDGNKFLTIIRDCVEYRMNSNYRPLEEANRWSKQYDLINVNVILQVFGFGNGYCIRELKSKLRDGDRIIVVEPSYELFLHVLHEYDIVDILEDVRVSLTVTELNVSMLGVLLSQYVHWMNLQSQIICIHPQYDKCFGNECKEYLAKIEDSNYRTLVNRNTEAYFGRDLVNNTIYNYRFIPNSNYLMELVGKINKDIPAIIVAAGPSLDLNIEELKRAKGRAVIIATDTALRYLYKHGIQADFAVTMDPQKPPSYFDNIEFEDLPLFCGSEANKNALCKHRGRKIWFGCHSFISTLYQRFGKKISTYNPGGSVATAAFSIGKTLGFETIILIGQDLAYKGDITHAEGDICRVQNEESGICYLEGIDGKPVKSRHDWKIYLKWFESSILETKGMGRVIDATEGGAKIHGTEIMTLKDAIDLYCKEPIDVAEIMQQLPVTFDRQGLKLIYDYLEQAHQEVKSFPSKAEEVVTLCKKGLNELKKANRPSKLAQIGKEIVERNKDIAEKPVFTLIDNIIKHDALKEIQEICVINKDEREGFIETYESTQSIFISVGKASEEIEPLLKEAVEEFNKYVRSESDAK